MCLTEATVRPVMSRRGHGAGRGRRVDHFTVPTEGGLQLYAYFQVDLAVQVDRDVTARPRDRPRPDNAPHRPASGRHNLREVLGRRPTADHCERTTGVLFEAD